MDKKPLQISTSTKLLFLFIFSLGGLLISGMAIVVSEMLFTFNQDTQLYLSMVLQSILAIAMPAVAIALWSRKSLGYLGIDREGVKVSWLLFALLLFLVSYPLSSLLWNLNNSMVLPESLKSIEKLMRNLEDQAQHITEQLLSVKTFGRLIVNLIVIALLPALSEELFFRGALQNLLAELFKNQHAAVWVTATIFSFVHLQFFGFAPRLLLGALLGYLFVYSGNLWAPILFHFVNNATVIVVYFFFSDREWFADFEDFTISWVLLVVALVSAVATFFMLHYAASNSKMRGVTDKGRLN